MYLITVKVSENQTLVFSVDHYEREGNHIKFTDSKTGLEKSFPDHICYIEEKGAEA